MERESIDDRTFKLIEQSTDNTYGYKPENPINVGGPSAQAVQNERRFLNALLGPNGEEVGYFRVGSCCGFKTANSAYGDYGMLDRYKVYWNGIKDTVQLFINMYDASALKIPVGFTAKKE
jgi:hypothetical protein